MKKRLKKKLAKRKAQAVSVSRDPAPPKELELPVVATTAGKEIPEGQVSLETIESVSPSRESQAAVSEIPTPSTQEPQVPEESQSGTVVKAPAPSGLNVGRRVMIGARKLREKVFGSRKATEEEMDIRRDYAKVVNRFKVTSEIIKQNTEVLGSLAKENVQVADLLKRTQDPKLAAMLEKVVQGQEVYPEEARAINESLQSVADGLNKVGVELTVGFPQVIKFAKDIMQDSRLDLQTRREALSNVVELAEKYKVDTLALQSIKKLMGEGVNFTKDQVDMLGANLEKLEEDTTGIKIKGTLEQMNKKLESMVFNQEKLDETLDKNTSTMGSVKEWLEKKGLGAIPSQTTKGLFQLGLQAVGLGGLDDILSAVGLDMGGLLGGGLKRGGRLAGKLGKFGLKGLGSLLGSASTLAGGSSTPVMDAVLASKGLISKIPGMGGIAGRIPGPASFIPEVAAGTAGKAGGLLGKLGGFGGKLAGAGKFLGAGARVLGKAALPLTLAMGAFDAYKGFTDAESIAGLAPGQKAGMGTKVGAGISGLLSGLTFGLVDPKTIFSGLSKGVSFLFGKEGILTQAWGFFKKLMSFTPIGMIIDMFKMIGDGVGSLFGEEGIFTKMSEMVDKVVNFSPMSGIKSFLGFGDKASGVAAKSDGKVGYIGSGKSAIKVTSALDTKPVLPKGKKSSIVETGIVDTRSSSLASAEARSLRLAARATEANQGKPVVVTVPQQQSMAPARVNTVDDNNLAFVKYGLGD